MCKAWIKDGKWLLPLSQNGHVHETWNEHNLKYTTDINDAFVGWPPRWIRTHIVV